MVLINYNHTICFIFFFFFVTEIHTITLLIKSKTISKLVNVIFIHLYLDIDEGEV